MTDTNGSTVDFTHSLTSFTLNGYEFHRRKVAPRAWAETLARVANEENVELKKKEGSQLFGVSGDGLAALIRLCIADVDVPTFDQMYEDGLVEFGELTALRDWVWEEMTARPFSTPTPSSDGPGTDSEASSKAASSSPAEVSSV